MLVESLQKLVQCLTLMILKYEEFKNDYLNKSKKKLVAVVTDLQCGFSGVEGHFFTEFFVGFKFF